MKAQSPFLAAALFGDDCRTWRNSFSRGGEIEPGVHRQQANCHSHFNQVRREANGLVRGLAGFVVRFRRIVYGKAGSVLTPGLASLA